jgi:transitional endoplasmic reticulum ATPase
MVLHEGLSSLLPHLWIFYIFKRKGRVGYGTFSVNQGDVDVDQINRQISRFTPADIQYLFERIAQFAFEQELTNKQEYFVTTETVGRILEEVRPSLTDEVIEAFDKDSGIYARS